MLMVCNNKFVVNYLIKLKSIIKLSNNHFKDNKLNK